MIDLNITFFIQCINFLVSLFIINSLIVSPIRGILAKRKAELERIHIEISHIKDEMDALYNSYETSIAEAFHHASEQKKLTLEKSKSEAMIAIANSKEHALAITLEMEKNLATQCANLSQSLNQSVYSFAKNIVQRLVG